ncbi:MAG TPA: PAS domain S-box protein [Vicinamibacterales bacterium]|nr:PAS domain S-box protein [Vicinamibacterales bacterium]
MATPGGDEQSVFRVLFDAMPQLGWTAQPDGFIDYFNRGWYEYTGATYEQMQGWGWQSVHDPQYLPLVKAMWTRAIESGEAVELEFPLRRRDGVFRWFLTRVQPIRDESGRLVRWVGINTDIHDQRMAQMASQEQRARYAALFSQAPVAICLLRGPSHIVELANPLMCQLLGRQPGQVLDKPIFEALPELEGQGFVELLDGVFRTGVPFAGSETPARLDRKGDGTLETGYFTFVYEPMRDEAGVVDGVAVVAVDVTAQVAARDTIAQKVKQSDFEASVGGALTSGDPLAVQLTRCCEAMVRLGAAFARIWIHDEASGMLELRSSAGLYTHLDGAHSRVKVGEFKIGRIAAERRPHLTNEVFEDPRVSDPAWARREGLTAFAGYPLLLGDRLVGVMALFAKEPLSDDVLQALGAVANQIALAIDRDQIERFRELFIGMVGHDLRNPLNAILMGTQLMIRDPNLPDGPKRTAGRMQRSVYRMSRMVDQLLDYTRARSGGGIPLIAVPADLVAICRETAQELAQAHPDRTFELDVSGSEEGEWDVDRMEQVFSNLLGNAVTYGAADQAIRVTLGGDAAVVVGEVVSFGAPIPPGDLPHIFEPFRRGNAVRPASVDGLGLGLFITRQIIQAHGGTIRVSSSGEAGTSFVFEMPRRRVRP